ncbi:hypothetical protein [Solibacillus sp. FSL K6-1523]|uniref:hypothetical protein n=1 Tax=Solibacillus sp. FSL K6-1523 TaxID=2921471 RepID=UPI0030F6E7BF
MELASFVCTECGGVDEVPAYIIGEFMVDKKPEGAVTLECQKWNGVMYEAKNDPLAFLSLLGVSEFHL